MEEKIVISFFSWAQKERVYQDQRLFINVLLEEIRAHSHLCNSNFLLEWESGG